MTHYSEFWFKMSLFYNDFILSCMVWNLFAFIDDNYCKTKNVKTIYGFWKFLGVHTNMHYYTLQKS